MRAPRFFITLSFSVAISGLLLLSIAQLAHAAVPEPFIYGERLFRMPFIPNTGTVAYQTALKAGDAAALRVLVHSIYYPPPVLSVDIPSLDFSNVSATGTWAGYSTTYYPAYFYDFDLPMIGADVPDGVKEVSLIATDAAGNIATGTARIIVDNVKPAFSLTSATFATTSPTSGDAVYVSGSVNGTGTAVAPGAASLTLLDANHRFIDQFGGTHYILAFRDAFASSTVDNFSNAPLVLLSGVGLAKEIASAAYLRVDALVYDEAGNIATSSITVPMPKPIPPDPCAAPGATCASNVLFLPGIEASRLYRPDYSGGTDRLWEPNADSDAEDLFLATDGTSVRNDVYTRDVIDEAYGAGPNIYKSFIAQMNGLKAADTIVDWEAVPYDWRLSFDEILNNGRQFPDGRIYYAGDLAATSSPYIIQELRRLANSSRTGKVTVVAHSNGGLLAKALTEKLGDAEAAKLIDKIIFVAVPQAGTPQAVGALLHGYEQGLPRDWLSIFLTPGTARALAANMPSVYNLLPSANYFTFIDDPVVTFDNSDFLAEFRARYGDKVHSGEQLRNFVTDMWRLASSSPSDLQYPSVGNAALLSRAETLHTTLDSWTPPQEVSLYEVAGWGEDTLATIEYEEGKKSYCRNPGDIRTCTIVPAITYYPKEVIEGDGTVLVPSALWTTASATAEKYWVNLRDYDTVFNYEREHADILEVPELRILIRNILTNSTSTIPLDFISTSAPPADSTKRLRFLLHSPLNLSAIDNLGNIISSATSTIPGARWKRYGEVQVLSVPENTPLTLNLDGYAAGSFTLDIEEIDGNSTITASSTLSAIPSATGTQATMSFPDGTLQNASPLLLDYDGNGTTDFSLKSEIGKEVVFDTTPPEATLTFDPVLRQLKIIGTDNISGITVLTTATSSVITDEAGNTLEIVFKRNKQAGKELKVEVQGLYYNGVPAEEIPKTVLQYEWSVDKTGKVKELQEKASIGSLKINGHYDAKKNVTRIERETRSGLVVIGLTTNEGKIDMNY